MREDIRKAIFGGDPKKELETLRRRWPLYVLGGGFLCVSVLLIGVLAAFFELTRGDPSRGAWVGMVLSIASLGGGVFWFATVAAFVKFLGPSLAKLAEPRRDSGQATVLNLIGFAIFMVAIVAMLPLLQSISTTAGQVGGPMIGMIFAAIPVILTLVGIAGLIRYTERPF